MSSAGIVEIGMSILYGESPPGVSVGRLRLWTEKLHRANSKVSIYSSPDRVIDILLALVFLVACLPVLFIAMLVVKLENPRANIFFRQTRYGYRGQPFTIIKLRTMEPTAEMRKAELISLSLDKGPGFKVANDPRITRAGHWLRRCHIDEIPQFLNVLNGDMSLVGPRPNSYSPDVYEPWQKIRLLVKPGLTGSWQIARIKPHSFEDRCLMDLRYIEKKCLSLDLSIILLTIWSVLTRPSGS
jgi:lipopolysaccharide/colanic/teichoic acid biosynthesis glycosyltransferase